jgi:hypothetical protein
MMRLLTILVLIAAAAWAGYWAIGSRALDRAAREFLDTQPGASYAALRVAGFPNRFDLTVEGIHLESPDGRTAWDAPFAQIFALSYKPWHVIAALPNSQTLRLDGQTVTVDSSYLQASLVVTPDRSAALDRLSLVGRDLALLSDQGWAATAAEVNLATRRDPVNPLAHQIGLRVTRLAPGPLMPAGAAALPPSVDLIHADLTARFTAPLDRFAAESQPRIALLDVRSVSIIWGGMRLSGQGSLAPDAAGLAEGKIELQLTNWRALPPALVALGTIQPEAAAPFLRALEVIAATSPDPETAALPLVFTGGWVNLGPFPLGPAPRLN